MRAFFEIVARPPRPIRDADWDERLGIEVVESLRELAVVERGELATTYPCDHRGRRTCHREVEPHPYFPKVPFTHCARCSDPEQGECRVVELKEDDLQASQYSRHVLLSHLQALLGLPPARPEPQPGLEATFHLGRRGWAGNAGAVVVSWDFDDRAFSDFLHNHQANDGPALVLVPVGDQVETRVRDGHKPNDTVAVVGLERLLELEAGRFVLTPFARSHLSALSISKVGPTEEHFVYVVESDLAERKVSHDQYLALAAKAAAGEYDLFLDLWATPKHGNRAAGRRWETGGQYEPLAIPAAPAITMAQVICAKEGVLGKDFIQGYTRPAKTFSEGRGVLGHEVKTKTGATWELFRTLRGDVSGQTRFKFSPPEGFRYLVLHNLPEELRKRKESLA